MRFGIWTRNHADGQQPDRAVTNVDQTRTQACPRREVGGGGDLTTDVVLRERRRRGRDECRRVRDPIGDGAGRRGRHVTEDAGQLSMGLSKVWVLFDEVLGKRFCLEQGFARTSLIS